MLGAYEFWSTTICLNSCLLVRVCVKKQVNHATIHTVAIVFNARIILNFIKIHISTAVDNVKINSLVIFLRYLLCNI